MDCSKLDLSPQEVAKIAAFLGYGNPSATVWFIGMEEGLGSMGDEDSIFNLKARSGFENVMDLYEAHRLLRAKSKSIDIEIAPPRTQVWRFMAKIMLAREGCKNWHTSSAAKKYVSHHLGRKGRETFLTELSPIPKGKNSETRWMKELEKCDPELESRIEHRRSELKRLLMAKASHPPLVICYGVSKRAQFADLLQIQWEPAFLGVHAATNSNCLLLPFFGQGQMSNCVISRLLDSGLLGQ